MAMWARGRITETSIGYLLTIIGVIILVVGAAGAIAFPSSALTFVGVGIGFSIVGMAFVGHDLTNEMRRSEIDEKVAMLWGYAWQATQFPATEPPTSQQTQRSFWVEFFLQKVKADIRVLGRLAPSLEKGQRQTLVAAEQGLIEELNRNHYDREAGEIQAAFNSELA